MHRAATIAVLFLTLSASLSLADSKEKKEIWVNEEYDLVKIADGIYSFISPLPDDAVVQSNCTLIIGDQSALLVDSGQFPSLAKRMLADIRKLTNKPVRYLVNTHWHFDHNFGNATFRAAYPDITIISTGFTRKLIADEGPKLLLTQAKTNSDQ